MTFRTQRINNRSVWLLDNECATIGIMPGGGHICLLQHKDVPGLNPLWQPHWPQIEPWQYARRHAAQFGNSKLLASIAGHNLCLAGFGVPSEEEQRAGMDCHYEAPVMRWRLIAHQLTPRRARIVMSTVLPAAQMRVTRTVQTTRGSCVIYVADRVENMARRDVPFTMCQHVSMGAPFLEKGVTVFDMPATHGHTFPYEFGRMPRLQRDAAFTWPHGPGVRGTVDLRTISATQRVSSDFSTQLIDPRLEHAWFSAVNPRRGLLLAYVWRREDYPWVGNWEENYCRTQAPWNGKELVRGMEFANTPFPDSVRNAVERATFHGQRTYAWLPARTTRTYRYAIMVQPVPRSCRGVRSISLVHNTPRIECLG